MNYKTLLVLSALVASPAGLLATSDNDQKIDDAVKNTYNYHAVLGDRVTATSNDGVVTLTGTVQDNDSKALAQDTVANMPGVMSVNNDIVVKSMYAEHSDEWIAVKIRSLLLVKGHVSAATTKVAVLNGVVTLTGTADTMAQKELTEVYAKQIDWVKSVRNDIMVNEKPVAEDGSGTKVDDASITTQVKYALLTHKSTSAVMTKVTTTDGVVVITGEADSSDEKALVTKLASDVRGAMSVTNNMTIKS
jgi:hyperosmotically inducible protein